MNSLDAICRVNARDCLIQDKTVIFLVPEKHMRLAIGKNGVTIDKVRKTLNKNVELFEYCEKPEEFFSKAFHKATIDNVEIRRAEEKNVAIIRTGSNDKKVILHNLKRLGKIKELAKRNYDIDEVRIR